MQTHLSDKSAVYETWYSCLKKKETKKKILDNVGTTPGRFWKADNKMYAINLKYIFLSLLLLAVAWEIFFSSSYIVTH